MPVLVPTNIDATGSSDVTLALQGFLDTVPDGSEIIFPNGGNYRVEGSLYLQDRNNLTFRGNGTKVFATGDGSTAPTSNLPTAITFLWPRKRGQFILRGGSNYIFTNFIVQGANPYDWQQEESYNAAYEAQHNFDIEGTHGVLIWKCELRNPWGDFVYCGMWTAYNSDWSYDVTVVANLMHDNGRQGVSFVGTRDVVVEDNDIYNTRRATFDIEPDGSTSGSYNLHIRKNRAGQGRLLFVASGGQPGDIHNVLIEGNTMLGRAMSIACGSTTQGERHNWTIRENVGDPGYLYGSPRALIEMVGVDDVYIRNNIHWFAPMQPDDLPGEGNDAVYLEGTRGYVVTGNTWTGAENELVNVGSSATSVTTPAASQPPMANAGNNQSVSGTTATLNGVASDSDGTVVSYLWKKMDGPAGGAIASVTSASTTISGLEPGIYLYRLTVTDDSGRVGIDHVEVTVLGTPTTTTTSSTTTTTTIAPTTTSTTTTTTQVLPSTTTTTTTPDKVTVDRTVRKMIHLTSKRTNTYKLYSMPGCHYLRKGNIVIGHNYLSVDMYNVTQYLLKVGDQQFIVNLR